MKLRNKKTGEIKEWQKVGAIDYGELNEVYDAAEYNSLAELNDEWEDYKPVEPLIEDQKTRKVFREWADLLGAKLFRVEHLCEYSRTIITSIDLVEEPEIGLPGYFGIDSETYTKEELCGEDEEMKAKTLSKQNLARLKDWAEKNGVIRAMVFFGRYGNTGNEFVRFRKSDDWNIVIEIKSWPRAGLENGKVHSIEELLDKVIKQ